MTTIELKNILIHKIAGINDKSFLSTYLASVIYTKIQFNFVGIGRNRF